MWRASAPSIMVLAGLAVVISPQLPSAQLEPLHREDAIETVSESDSQPTLQLEGDQAPLPLVYSDTFNEVSIQQLLHEGAVVLPLGYEFGEAGNTVIAAHSSGAMSFGPYRFAFSQLAELETGDTFIVREDDNRYVYRVYATDIVWPYEIDQLPSGQRSTVTLVTCWPLWTDYKRLLVHAELVS